MAPGVWEKQGVGYRQRMDGAPSGKLSKEERREALSQLKDEIWAYAKNNDGKAPAGPFIDGMDLDVWRTCMDLGVRRTCMDLGVRKARMDLGV